MGYFAEIKDNIVQRVILAKSKEWCELRLGGEWIETKNVGIGSFYDRDKKQFFQQGYEPGPSFEERLKALEQKEAARGLKEEPIEETKI